MTRTTTEKAVKGLVKIAAAGKLSQDALNYMISIPPRDRDAVFETARKQIANPEGQQILDTLFQKAEREDLKHIKGRVSPIPADFLTPQPEQTR